MMSKIFSWLTLAIVLAGCNQEERIFEQSADARVAAAVDSLQQKLTSAPNGWIVRYRPVSGSGAFNVLLTFQEDNQVNIRTDFGANEGVFYDQTITYRIDNSLGLELIFESYSFFSYLFEQNQATYGGEFEFNYVNDVDGALIFNSKSDTGTPSILALQPAGPESTNQLGITLARNLNTLSSNLPSATAVYKLVYDSRDLALYFSFNDFERTISFSYAAPAQSIEGGRSLNFSTPYTIQGDSVVFDTPLEERVMGEAINVPGIRFNTLTDGTFDLCGQPTAVKEYAVGVGNASATITSTLFDPAGRELKDDTQLFISSVLGGGLRLNSASAAEQLREDIPDMLFMVLLNRSDTVMEIGYYAVRDEGTVLFFEMRRFNPTFEDNRLRFDFAEGYTSYGDTTSVENQAALNTYLEALTQEESTYVLKSGEGRYELYNPCSGWSYAFRENG